MSGTLHQLTKNTKLLQKMALVKDNKILILKRSDDAHSRAGMWDLPGGNLEWPDSKVNLQDMHLADMEREVLEETGIRIQDVGCRSQDVGCRIQDLVLFRTFFEAERQVFSVIVGWKLGVSSLELDIRLSDEHTAYAWVTKEELNDYDFGGDKGEFIVEIIKKSF